jgi:hypothetical protein
MRAIQGIVGLWLPQLVMGWEGADFIRDVGVGGSNPLTPTNNLRSIPITWVTVYSGDMGDTLAAKGFSALSILHVSWSKNPKS